MSPAQPRNPKSSSEDVLQYLVNYDVIILMDDSGSMSLFNGSSKSLWDQVWGAVITSTTAGADDMRVRRWKLCRK
jgi:hypothetical protein